MPFFLALELGGVSDFEVPTPKNRFNHRTRNNIKLHMTSIKLE